MAKKAKKKERPEKYEKKLAVDASFEEFIDLALGKPLKEANIKMPEKK